LVDRFALTQPLEVEVGAGETTIKAMAWARGMEPSHVVSAKFVVYGYLHARTHTRTALGKSRGQRIVGIYKKKKAFQIESSGRKPNSCF
jgi:hypothetical protein